MNVAGLFAGIGGFEIGLSRAGHDTTMPCEIWDPARAMLARRFQGIDCHADIGDLPDLPKDIELVVAGFPCQDFSQAGMTAGIDGSQSSLVAHVFRLLDRRPAIEGPCIARRINSIAGSNSVGESTEYIAAIQNDYRANRAVQ